MMIKKRYLTILSVVIVAVLLGSLFHANIAQALALTGKPQPSSYKDSIEITLLDMSGDNVAFGVRIYSAHPAILPFPFNPKDDFLSITGIWITTIAYSSDYVRHNITVKNITLKSTAIEYHGSYPIIASTYIDASELLPETITSGTNVLTISNPEVWDNGTGEWTPYWLLLFKVTVFIEYEYQIR